MATVVTAPEMPTVSNFVAASGEGDLCTKVDALAAELGDVKAELGGKVDALGGKVDALGVKLDALAAELGGVKTLVIGIQAGQDNVLHRIRNGMSQLVEHVLQPLKAERGQNAGQYPPPELFPATLEMMWTLSNPSLDALAAFYGIAFEGKSLAARQITFKCFIGAR